MIFDKQALTFEEQADRLLSRGLIADRDELIERLRCVNYYRLSAYLYPFRNENDDTFLPGTTFEKVWARYRFDRQLRLSMLDTIERIEVSVRTDIIYALAHTTGPFGYLDNSNLPGLSATEHETFLVKVCDEICRSKERFLKHFRKKYGDTHNAPPIWMVGEIMSLGTTARLFGGMDNLVKNEIAGRYGVSDTVFLSWIVCLYTLRNASAHHARIWDRTLGVSLKIPRGSKYPDWSAPIAIPRDKMFGALTVCKYLMDFVAPSSGWSNRFQYLLTEYPTIPLDRMGFPDNWRECPIWKSN